MTLAGLTAEIRLFYLVRFCECYANAAGSKRLAGTTIRMDMGAHMVRRRHALINPADSGD